VPPPNEPSVKTQIIVRTMAPQAPDVCSLCLGAGHYHEVISGDPRRELVPVQCSSCDGSGRRRVI
jgi:DnaJ-class molecular chaperone